MSYYVEYADSLSSMESFTVKKPNYRLTKQYQEVADNVQREIFQDQEHWLKEASVAYDISHNIDDYVLVPVDIMWADIPNTNAAAFPLEQLLKYQPEAGMQSFRTWKGKPTHKDHKNDNVKEAKGVVFDSVMLPVLGNYPKPLQRVTTLLGFDRTKDFQLYSDIKNQVRRSYSMGARAGHFECSICGCSSGEPNNPGDFVCGHVSKHPPARAKMKKIGDYLAFRKAIDVIGFEVSSVGIPAFPQSYNPNVLT